MSNTTCSIEDCDRTNIAARGWCWRHYQRWRLKGTLDDPSRANQGDCSVNECESPAERREMCGKHYSRVLRTGTTESTRAEWGSERDGPLGYMVQTLPDHPLANANGVVYVHRKVLYERIGDRATTCAFCAREITWGGLGGVGITAEHLDGDKKNNHPLNLVAACLPCNVRRVRWLEGYEVAV